jgi:putative dimethyl sulfoxide reductase chaperone
VVVDPAMNGRDHEGLDAQLEIAYRLLSASLYQPSEEWHEENIFANLGEALKEVSPETVGMAAIMKESSRNRTRDELSLAFARLFVGPFHLQAPPYGSVYLEPGNRVMGETTMAVNRFYEESGLSLDGDSPEMPDHMAVELEFMSYLLQRAMRAEEEGDTETYSFWVEKRRSFLGAFLSRWYGEFCDNIRNGTDDRFYLAFADCLEGVVKRDMEVLSPAGKTA